MIDLEWFLGRGSEWADLTPLVAPAEPEGVSPDGAEETDDLVRDLGARLRSLGRAVALRCEVVRFNKRDGSGRLVSTTWKARVVWTEGQSDEEFPDI